MVAVLEVLLIGVVVFTVVAVLYGLFRAIKRPERPGGDKPR